ncbi:hypothetical protein BJ170DRAFT_458931 [Xylariales sp. AK1849]|nr:hypothetical protein BJ170DRAFT_458931 [Xylariales sp. AK1849]
MDDSAFMRAPAEVRMMIYNYLFIDNGSRTLCIRSGGAGKVPKTEQRIRSRYYVVDQTIHRRCHETTYQLAGENVYFCAALMHVNRRIYEETSYMVYGKHSFDFGRDIEAVEPFLTDITPFNRHLIREISLYKSAPILHCGSDRCEWRNVCRFLQSNDTIKKLRLVVQAGRPSKQWDGPKEFSVSDFKLLADLKHESLDWICELAQVQGIQELEVLSDVHYCPPPTSTGMLIFAAISASIERGLAEFLRMQLKLG